MQEIGFGLTREMVGNVVMDYLKDKGRQNPFLNGKPGNDWWLGFMRRWPKLVERKPQHLPANRAMALTEVAINAWISKVKSVIEEAGLKDLTTEELAKRMWNCDETAFATDVASKKILAKRGEKNVHETGGGSGREYITVLGCGSASGQRLPPYVLYKGKNLWTSWTKGGPCGTYFNVSDSGWMERPHFLEWFRKLFLPAVSIALETGPVILFMDGHASHINLQLIRLARERGVVLLCLPSHTTHALQPLDVGVYGPLKSRWGKILKEYKMETCAAVVDKTEFPSLLEKLWEESFEAKHLKAGFRKAGLCPLSTENIPKSSFAPSLPHTLAPSESQTSTQGTATGTATGTTTGTATGNDAGTDAGAATGNDADTDAGATDTHLIHVKVSCCECYNEKQLTPVRVYFRGYFARLLGKNKMERKKTARRKVKALYSGEALTADDIYERLEEEEKRKEQQKSTRAKTRKG